MIGHRRIITATRGLVLLTGLAGLSMLAGCVQDPYLPGYGSGYGYAYAYRAPQPIQPPLQPYVDPAIPPGPAVAAPKHTSKRRYVKRHRYRNQVRCPCLPAQ